MLPLGKRPLTSSSLTANQTHYLFLHSTPHIYALDKEISITLAWFVTYRNECVCLSCTRLRKERVFDPNVEVTAPLECTTYRIHPRPIRLNCVHLDLLREPRVCIDFSYAHTLSPRPNFPFSDSICMRARHLLGGQVHTNQSLGARPFVFSRPIVGAARK
jgi:hypothetical protein